MPPTPAAVARLLVEPPQGVDFVELRLDALDEPTEATVKQLFALPRSVPVLAAARACPDKLDDKQRLALLAVAGECGADIIDVDDSLLADFPKSVPGDRLASAHVSRFVPRLEALAERVAGADARFKKLAIPANSPVQLAELLDLQDQHGGDFAMVTTGRLSEAGRVMAAGRGAPLCYAAADAQAPGHADQPSADRLHCIYHVGTVGPGTRFFAVVGHPIAHSMSPTYHNTIFRRTGLDVRLVTLDVDDMRELLAMSDALRIDGLSITHPFKREALSMASTALPGALSTGAANTLMRTPTGWQARNTDWKAACDLLPKLLRRWRKAHAGDVPEVLLLGAGGAARALAIALMEQGADISIWSRHDENAVDLAEELDTRAVSELAGTGWDFIINCTPVGMDGVPADGLPVAADNFRAGALALDLTYGDGPSCFRDAVAASGATLTTGEEFFALQARRQAELFSGGPISAELHKESVAALS